MQKIIITLCLICLLILSGSRCNDYIFSPFFNRSEDIDPETPNAELRIEYDPGSTEADTGCSIKASSIDSVLLLNVYVGDVSPQRVQELYSKVTLEVSVGLPDLGLVIADTSDILLNKSGMISLVLPIESPEALSEPQTRVSVIAITRYLEAGGNLALPMGRNMRYCTVVWQNNQ